MKLLDKWERQRFERTAMVQRDKSYDGNADVMGTTEEPHLRFRRSKISWRN